MADYAGRGTPFQDSPSTATPIQSDFLNGVDAALVDVAGASGRLKALEQNPLVTADKSGAAVGDLLAVTAVSGGNATSFARVTPPMNPIAAAIIFGG
ncbi:MAG: hypothetical protein EPO40_03140 [Myxococcaceae bacterium]|nr:MAG: hypothetical protein EPO40_03140 [Myxococcaceae bacterium]